MKYTLKTKSPTLLIEATSTEMQLDVQKHGLDPVAVVGLVLGSISTADVVWKWWTKYRSTGLRFLLFTTDGVERELSTNDEEAFKAQLDLGDDREATDDSDPDDQA